MKTLVNKNKPAIRITAEVETLYDKSRCIKYYYIKDLRMGLLQDNWTLVEEEPEVDLEKLALEKYPIQMVTKDPFDEEDDSKEDLNEFERDAYLQGLKVGYNLIKGGKV